MFTSISPLVGTAAIAYGVLAALSVLLQARQMLTRRDSCELSVRFFASYVGGYAIWLLYGLSVGNVPLIVVDAVGLLCAGLTLAVAVSLRGPLFHPASWADCTAVPVSRESPQFAPASGERAGHLPVQASREGYSHLPADLQDAIAAYDARVASGAIRFDAEGHAVHQPDAQGGWIASNLRAHLSVLDLWPHGKRPTGVP